MLNPGEIWILGVLVGLLFLALALCLIGAFRSITRALELHLEYHRLARLLSRRKKGVRPTFRPIN